MTCNNQYCPSKKIKVHCPHADGRRVICKHMIALYFTVFPKEAKNFITEAQEYEKKKKTRTGRI